MRRTIESALLRANVPGGASQLIGPMIYRAAIAARKQFTPLVLLEGGIERVRGDEAGLTEFEIITVWLNSRVSPRIVETDSD